jgi:hypothetical protein
VYKSQRRLTVSGKDSCVKASIFHFLVTFDGRHWHFTEARYPSASVPVGYGSAYPSGEFSRQLTQSIHSLGALLYGLNASSLHKKRNQVNVISL